ncbi:MAG TPA: M48 family metallopeptidase [Opitutaceae bacterium]|nr:M48 family metallopeptidase [Opitutaceae bacterium]HOR25223.1 M48 family metallopeptidase [Opitutaceae bacterium]HPK49641.1 M48 family metallopeptidase [Opitutaceae bacterium]
MVLTVVAVVLGLHLAGELILAELNRREVRRHAGAAPAAVAAIVDEPTYAKSVEYTQAKLRFGMVSQVFDTALLAAVVFGGLLPWLYAKFAPMAPAGTWDDALFIGAALVLLSIPSQPFDWWSTFRLEARFGFNKSTLQLWLGDKLKGVMLAAVIGFPLLWALLSLVLWVGRWWWLWGFALIFAFQLLMMVLYPKLILPLFNKLTPLPDGELRTRLLALADRTGFKAQTIEVIDGSKRSGHSNAYFTGFGRFRRIVLFDTLISQLTPEELEAVLAHEIGHYRRGHIPRMLAISAIIQLGALAAIAALAASGWFNPAFGFPAGEIAPAFLLFGLLSGAAMFWLTPLANLFSRKHEYEADAFAREAMGGPAPLVAALRKLAQKNLSNLTPHPWYSGFHYSHPTLVERERALTA